MTAQSPAPVVVTTAEQLRELVREAVTEALAEQKINQSPRLLDRRSLAEALGCCIDVVDRLRREGLPEITLLQAPRFELERCLEWLRERGKP